MENQVDRTKILTSERFKLGHSVAAKKLNQFGGEGLINDTQVDAIQEEDLLLSIKYRTYKKCIKQLIIGLVAIGIGVGFMGSSSLRYLFIVGGFIFSISSFFGIVSNRLTKNQIEYLKN